MLSGVVLFFYPDYSYLDLDGYWKAQSLSWNSNPKNKWWRQWVTIEMLREWHKNLSELKDLDLPIERTVPPVITPKMETP